MKNLRKGFLYLNILFVLLLIVNAVPRSAIERNLIKTAEYFKDIPNRYYMVEGLPQTTHDAVTDAIAFNLIANIDSSHVLSSTLESVYYMSGITFGDDIYSYVVEGEGKAFNYSRYWHGYSVIYRFLLLFTSVQGIKVIMFISFILLSAILVYFSIRKKLLKFSLFFLTSCGVCLLPFAFHTLGHITPYFIALIGCIIILSDKFRNMNFLFLSLGISVAFFDFLSVETLTLTLPLLCLLIEYHQSDKAVKFKEFCMLCVNWLVGYAMTFIYKWILVSVLVDKSLLSLALEKGKEEFAFDGKLTSSLALNMNMLFPYMNSSSKAFNIFLLILIGVSIILYLFHKNGCNKHNIIIYLILIFLIPYVRYLVLTYHSANHFFFTFREQISSIMCLFFIVYYSLGIQIKSDTK